MVFVLSGPARPRSVVTSTSRRLPPSRSARSGWSSPPSTAAQVGEDLVELLAVRPRGERRVLGALELRRSHELHRPGDLLDVPDGTDAAPDLALAGHVRCLVLAVPRPGTLWRKSSTALVEGRLELVGQGLGLAELLQDLRALGLEEAVELGLELLDPRGRDVVELAGRRHAQDGHLLLDRQRLVLRLLDDLATASRRGSAGRGSPCPGRTRTGRTRPARGTARGRA